MNAPTTLIQPGNLLPLERVAALSDHHNTVMGLSVAHDAACVASIDYDGVWIVRDEMSLKPHAARRMDGRGRGIALSPNGARIAGLLALRDHSDTRYSYDVVVADVADGAPIAIVGERVRGAAWTPDSEQLVVTGGVGFRVHDHSGALVRSDESPKGWSGACVSADARCVYFIRRSELGCIELATSRDLPAPDISPFKPPSNSPGWDSDGLALSRMMEFLTTGRVGGGIYIWDLATADAIAELRWDGPQVFCTRAVFAPDGRRVVASFHHVVTQHANGRVTHVLFDLDGQRIVGGIDTLTRLTGFHSTACFSADGHRLYVSEGNRIHVCEVP
jgi:hypothetical protein